MNASNEILKSTGNRYFPLPDQPWKYFQQWDNTLFLHWKCSVSALRQYVPPSLEIDTVEGNAWVSLVVFSVKKLRMNGLPWLPYVSKFEEINLRTYVVKDGIRGIYMFSLETNKFLTVLMTRIFIGLPYILSKIVRKQENVKSQNTKKKYALKVKYKAGSSISKTPIDFWLTERHCLYEIKNARMHRFDIHHTEWVLKYPILNLKNIEYRAGKLDLSALKPDLKHYGASIKVLLWGSTAV
jgi:uncharacterized protein YqjF (DUF2071 family)